MHKTIRQSITRKDLRPNQSLTGVFPKTKHTYILQHLASQRDWTSTHRGLHQHHHPWSPPRSSKVYSSWNNIDQFAKPTKKELSSIQRERGIKQAINNPANPSRGRTISCLCSTVTVNLVFFERFYQRTPPEENNNNRTEKF